jgi:hypothetical protein
MAMDQCFAPLLPVGGQPLLPGLHTVCHRTSAGEMRGGACAGEIGAGGAGVEEIAVGCLAPCRRDVCGRPVQVQEPLG